MPVDPQDAVEPDGPAPSNPGLAGDMGVVENPEAPRPRRLPRKAVALYAAVVLAAGGVALDVTLSSGSGTPTFAAAANPERFVLLAASKTHQQGTADVVISGNLTTSGATIPIQGSGNLNLAANSANLDLTMNGTISGTQLALAERELVVGGQMYFGLTIDGKDLPAALAAGKEWIQIPIPVGASTTGASQNVNPVGMIQLAKSRGEKVTVIGTSELNGVDVEGFALTPSQAAIDQTIQRAPPEEGLSASEIRQAESVAHSFTFDVWFDASGLMRQEVVNIGSGGSSGTDGNITVTVESYGNPVQINAPAPTQVLSYKDFLADAQGNNAAET